MYAALAILMDRRCMLCGDYVGQDCLCLHCRLLLPYVPRRGQTDNYIELRLAGSIPLQRAYSMVKYSSGTHCATILMAIKYYSASWSACKLGEMMAADATGSGFFAAADVLQPVPLHIIRHLRRGYNQSERLAKGIGRISGLPVKSLVYRWKNTATQTEKTAEERKENMEGAFRGNRKRILKALQEARARGRQWLHIIIVDDVITTGSTIVGCAKAILDAVPDEAGYIRFSVMSLAVAGDLMMGRLTSEKLHLEDCSASSEEFLDWQHRPLA